MASIVQIPFNYNPASTSLKTSSYTIPAGKYAFVDPMFYDFTINGADVVTGPEILTFNNTVSAVGSTSIAYFTAVNPLNKNLKLRWSSSGTATQLVAATLTGTAGTMSVSEGFGASGTVYLFESALYGVNMTGNGTQQAQTLVAAQVSNIMVINLNGVSRTMSTWVSPLILKSVWVPSGTVLNGSRYMVTEYNAIS